MNIIFNACSCMKVHGLLFMLMFSDHIVGQQMFVEEKVVLSTSKSTSSSIWQVLVYLFSWQHHILNLNEGPSIQHFFLCHLQEKIWLLTSCLDSYCLIVSWECALLMSWQLWKIDGYIILSTFPKGIMNYGKLNRFHGHYVKHEF